jgi:hypothetical protein
MFTKLCHCYGQYLRQSSKLVCKNGRFSLKNIVVVILSALMGVEIANFSYP